MITESQIKQVTGFLVNETIAHELDVSLQEFSYFCSGGLARVIVFPGNELQLRVFISFMASNGLEYKLIGDTSNLLFLDEHDYGVLLSLKSFSQIRYSAEEKRIDAQAGAGLPELSRKALLWGVAGFEGLEGIPGTIGGGVFMNAGAYGCEIKDYLISVRGFRSCGEPFELSKSKLEFTNRESLFRKRSGEYIITNVIFAAEPGNKQVIFDHMELFHAKRHRYQDFLYPTLGSLFSTRDIYSATTAGDRRYEFLLKWVKRLWYSKKIRRERPMNLVRLNRFVCRYFGWEFDVQPFSDKTMNCITNRGQHTDCFLEYIELLRKRLPDSVKLENEIMDAFYCQR